MPLIFKDIIDTLNVEITQDSTVWVLAGSLVLGCALTIVYILLALTDTSALQRWLRANRGDSLLRAAERSLCKRRAEGGAKSSKGDIRASAQLRFTLPPFEADRRVDQGY